MTITRFLQNPSRLTGLLYRKWLATTLAKQLHAYSNGQRFARTYLVISLIVLFGTTLFWGMLGARLQQSNADQLVSAYLFQDGGTFHGAVFPDQHSFLIKWPLFFIVKLFGYSSASFIGVTLVIVLLTVGMLVFLLSRINRQPVILGTICLALASVLLLTPAQPYPGGLLPVNMAMSTTRNLEYILYIVSLYYLVKAPRLKSKQFYAAVGLLSLLIASDKLFLYMSLGGAVLALASYASCKSGQFVNLSRRWFIAALGGGLGAAALIKLINYTHLTHIGTRAVAGLGPFGLAHGLKAIGLGGIYAVTGLLTNFGANPAYDSVTIQQIPYKIIHNMNSAAGPAYVINLCIFLFGLVICSKFLLQSLRFIKPKKMY